MDEATPSPEPGGSKPKRRRPRETRPLKLPIEVVAIGGKEGRQLHQLQADAVFDPLMWLANNPRPSMPDQPDHDPEKIHRPWTGPLCRPSARMSAPYAKR